ncbi:MAG: SigB/SigF/SigG family RNA polymerase sigma factor [Solirubrobacteraceae bacterium]
MKSTSQSSRGCGRAPHTPVRRDRRDVQRLFHRLRTQHDADSRERLVYEFMPLARWVARRFEAGRSAEDIRQVAYLGLLKAIDRFDPDHGNSFTTFAIPTISGEIRRHLRDCSWAAHVPRSLQERALQVRRASDALTRRRGRPPTAPELASALGQSCEWVLEALTAAGAYSASSLDTPVGAGGCTTSEGHEEPAVLDDGFQRVIERDLLRHALASLPERQRQMVGMRYFGGYTQSRIAAEFGVSQMQVSRVLRKALQEMGQSSSTASSTQDELTDRVGQAA